MAIAMWLVNLFSLFSCFGALTVLIFLTRREKKTRFWKLLAIVGLYVFSYASGIFYLIITYGFTVPEIVKMDLIPTGPDVFYYVQSVLYLFQFWLIISVTSDILDFSPRLSYLVFAPIAVIAFLIPDTMLLIHRDFVIRHSDFFIFVRLFLIYAIIEHVLITALIRRKTWCKGSLTWLSPLFIVFVFVVVPAMFAEDVLMLYQIIKAFNIVEATGFFMLMTTVMITGIIHLSSHKEGEDRPLTLLELSEQYSLTAREIDVLRELLAAANISYKEIASKLNISPETVKTHVSRIYRKLGVSAKQELKYKIGRIET